MTKSVTSLQIEGACLIEQKSGIRKVNKQGTADGICTEGMEHFLGGNLRHEAVIDCKGISSKYLKKRLYLQLCHFVQLL